MFRTLVFMELTCIGCQRQSLLNIFDVYEETSWTCPNCQKANRVIIKDEFKSQKEKVKDFVTKVQMVSDHALNSGIAYQEDSIKTESDK